MNTTTSAVGLMRACSIALILVSAACTADSGEGAPEAMTAAAPAPAPEQVAAAGGQAGETPYSVECATDPATGEKSCTVDKQTFVGWRMYHAFCHVCHAQDAVGSTFAPSLVERLQVIDKARFIDVVENGYTGQIGVMPGWKDNPNISKNYDELYAYLKARADGVLIPGRPKKRREESG